MINEPLTREDILRRLAEHLDDDTLRRIFPGEHPAAIRSQLGAGKEAKREVESIAPAPNKAPAASTLAGCCRLFTDGASRGNPGQAGAGAVLLDGHGEEVATCSLFLGVCTNNVAEYRALLLGLDEALRQGCTELAIALDSELIVRQVQGRYKVKNAALLPLFQQVRERLNRIKTWSITHVPRAQNARADQLANQGIDRKND